MRYLVGGDIYIYMIYIHDAADRPALLLTRSVEI